MTRVVLSRLGQTVGAVWLIISLVFLLSRHTLTGAEQLAIPDTADFGSLQHASARQQQTREQAIRHRFGLDIPLFYVSYSAGQRGESHWRWHGHHNQYHEWAAHLLRGEMGTSFRTAQPVAGLLRDALAYTLPLTGAAALLAAGLALWLAQRLAARPWWRGLVRGVLLAGQATPLLVVAVALLLALANPAMLAWFPAYGLGEDGGPSADNLLSRMAYWVLPVSTLVIGILPEFTLVLASSIELQLPLAYSATARAKGLGQQALIRRHVLRNALLPSFAQLAELLPALVAGAVVVEVVFALPGMGRLLADAAARRDYPLLIGGVLLVGSVRALALLLADLLSFWADPRLR